MTSSCFVMSITPTRIRALPFTVSGIEQYTRRLLNNVLIYKKEVNIYIAKTKKAVYIYIAKTKKQFT